MTTALRVAEEVRGLDSLESKVERYNEILAALQSAMPEVVDPAAFPRLVHRDRISPNDYNPNKVAPTELELLETSMAEDGITMPVVVAQDGDGAFSVVDGFHRRKVASERLMRQFVPVSIIDKPRGGRIASTVRHNRARGKHQIDLQGALVVALAKLGLSDTEISKQLGMSVEELLRMKQIVGAAKLIGGVEYSSTYGRDDEPPDLLGE